MYKSIKYFCAAMMMIMFCCPLVTQAHFIWIAKSAHPGPVKIFFGEGPQPDQAVFLDGLKDMQVWSLDENGVATKLKFVKKTDGSDGWLQCESDNDLTQVDANCEYGVFGRGDKTMFLHYAAKYVQYSPQLATKSSGKLPLDIEIKADETSVYFQVVHLGKAAANCELQIVDEDNNVHELKTDSTGKSEFAATPKGRWQIRAKVTDAKQGQAKGQSYDEKRYYCTLVLDLPKTLASGKSNAQKEAAKMPSKLTHSMPYPEIPVGVTSFGGAVAGDHVYIYGGHCGDAHDYYKSGQNQKLYRLNLKAGQTDWEEIHESRGLQGLAMVSHQGTLYRVGGFEARNEQDEDQDLHSVNEFAKFNFETKTWQTLKPMPSPRSSLDAVVVGDKLFVVGGWRMQGDKGTTWSNDMFWIDLSDKDADWQKIDVPFTRRALTAGYEGDKLFVVGGMKKKGGPTREVKIFDIASQKWSDGPMLPGTSEMQGFGCSCFNVGGKLVVSTYEGHVMKLNSDHSDWEVLHQLETGRFFHRLLPVSKNKFVLVGGANMEIGKMYDLPVFEF